MAQVTKSYTHAWKEVEEEWGEYVTPEKLAIDYGFAVNPAKACRLAGNYSAKCCQLGGQWIKYCDMAEGWFVFAVKHRFVAQFDKCWSKCTQYEGDEVAQQS